MRTHSCVTVDCAAYGPGQTLQDGQGIGIRDSQGKAGQGMAWHCCMAWQGGDVNVDGRFITEHGGKEATECCSPGKARQGEARQGKKIRPSTTAYY